MSIINEQNPWFYARRNHRDFLTAVDIQSAINAGVRRSELSEIVLQAMSRGWVDGCFACAKTVVEFKRD